MRRARDLTVVERWIDARATAVLARSTGRWRPWVVEAWVFVLKQAWACVFGVLILVAIVAVRLWWPTDAAIAPNDALVVVAVGIQVGMLVARLETVRELWVVLLFHVVGTVMELFKTDVGSWSYAEDGVLRIGGVPLFSGFMYAAIGSYMVRSMRLFDLRFVRYPPLWATIVLGAAIYANFYTHHVVWDARWVLVVAVLLLWGRTIMHFRVHARAWRWPLLVPFVGVGIAIWIAENVGTAVGAWTYPNQVDGWEPVSPQKVVSWFLLMIISVVLVTLVHRPRTPDAAPATSDSLGLPIAADR
ncbi:DUF817 domain-containing protein [Agrococcus sp. SGAir0287]|nr:DUF817 domain-containing protein [Agrococcus sp. SGAir0287]